MRSHAFVAFAAPLLLAACDVSVYSSTSVAPAAPELLPPAPPALAGWSIEGHARSAYLAEVDGDVLREGHPTIRFHPTRETGGAYATYMTSLDARPFRGRRAHATLWVRTQGVAARGDVWVRVQAGDSPADGPGLATSIARLPESSAFTSYELFVNVPDDAASVQVGLGLGGPGMAWMDGVTVEAL
jgi:hypothetical protein